MYLYVKKEFVNLKMIFSKSGFVRRFGKKKKGNQQERINETRESIYFA